jgi:hypothetical protein
MSLTWTSLKVRLFLIKSDCFIGAALSGTNQHNFFDYCNMRL